MSRLRHFMLIKNGHPLINYVPIIFSKTFHYYKIYYYFRFVLVIHIYNIILRAMTSFKLDKYTRIFLKVNCLQKREREKMYQNKFLLFSWNWFRLFPAQSGWQGGYSTEAVLYSVSTERERTTSFHYTSNINQYLRL